jgi:hypothetical protein
MDMLRIVFAAVVTLLSLGTSTTAGAQIGGAIKRKAAEALKDAGKKDTSKAAKPDTTSRKPTPSAAAQGASAAASTATAQKSDPKVWENYDFVRPAITPTSAARSTG